MRQIDVKPGKSKYRLRSDKGVFIGELVIAFDPARKTCAIEIEKIASDMESLSIDRR